MRSARDPYPWVLLCAAGPLVTGVGIFITWLALRWDGLMTAGLITILAGMLSVLFGTALLKGYVWMNRAEDGRLPKPHRKRVAVAAALLLLNFPAAFLCASTALRIYTTYYVTVSNQTATTVNNFAVYVDGRPNELGPISPGRSAEFSFVPRSDGQVTYTMTSAGQQSAGMVIGYVTPGFGSSHTVRITPTGVLIP